MEDDDWWGTEILQRRIGEEKGLTMGRRGQAQGRGGIYEHHELTNFFECHSVHSLHIENANAQPLLPSLGSLQPIPLYYTEK